MSDNPNIYDPADNAEAAMAWQCVEQTGINIFLTGKAGTGKTTFLHRLRQHSPKRMVVLAPTGVAAINAGGSTIHSFFQLPLLPYVPGSNLEFFRFSAQKRRIIETLDLLVIDEISMVRADLLDCVDYVLRRIRHSSRPFGGVQMLMIGDLQQLAPVTVDSESALLAQHYDTLFFYGSKALRQSDYVTIELRRVYRQSDSAFIDLLNRIREHTADAAVLDALNSRYVPNFDPPDSEGYIRLTTHNRNVDALNSRKMDLLPGPARTYRCKVSGHFPETSYPADSSLLLKEGAQVMFLKNGPGYYNGKLGFVSAMHDESVEVRCADGLTVELEYEEWTNSKYVLDPATNAIAEQVEGTFGQIPLRPAWAITIHKSQGLTFERAIVDAEASFAHGQVYVALSRCKSLEGMVLSSRLTPQSIVTDTSIAAFMRQAEANAVDEERLSRLKAGFYLEQLRSLFDFGTLGRHLHTLMRFFEEHLYRTYPQSVAALAEHLSLFDAEVADVARKFVSRVELQAGLGSAISADAALAVRIRKGAAYFAEHIDACLRPVEPLMDVELDNRDLGRQLRDLRKGIADELNVKRMVMDDVERNGFAVTTYLKARANAILASQAPDSRPGSRSGGKAAMPADIQQPQLFELLRQWRAQKAAARGVPAYAVLSQKALIAIANHMPATPRELQQMPSVGRRTMELHANDILGIVNEYRAHSGATPSAEPAPAEPEKPAAPKPSTLDVTLEAFVRLKSAEAVAAERGLAPGTIMGHLGRLAAAGRVQPADVLPAERIAAIGAAIDRLPPEATMAEVRQQLGNACRYDEIGFVRALKRAVGSGKSELEQKKR